MGALIELLDIDEPTPDTAWLIHAAKCGGEGEGALETAFFRLHNALLLKLYNYWKSRALCPADFEPLLAEGTQQLL